MAHPANNNLHVSNTMIEIVKGFEKLHKVRKDGKVEAYLDTAANPPVWTIGWGHTGTAKPGMIITIEQAIQLKKRDLLEKEDAVKGMVNVPLNQSQFDALVSLCFNIGQGSLSKSDIIKFVNQGNLSKAVAQIKSRVRNKAGQVLKGLIPRREAEAALFQGEKPTISQQTVAYSSRYIEQNIMPKDTFWIKLRSAVGA